ncbi:tetratricopeptide repeat protein [Streptomyces sp. RLB3-17]|nr:tetratricopeptide repeat protein [Streptomyces sp. RLB3-17]
MSTSNETPRPQVQALGQRSIAASQIVNAYTGDILLPVGALNAPERVVAAPGTSNLPPATLCLGREAEVTQLRGILTRQHETAITQSGAVHGLGGIGKSTLALHYSHRYRSEYTLIWWVNAASPEEIESSLTGLTRSLVPAWADSASRTAQVAWAKQWLTWHPGWLLVYDNVENPDDLTPYTGALHKGHHLATSRLIAGWPDGAVTLTLGNLNADDSTTLLCQLVFKDISPTPQHRAEARALVKELGQFPLAIKQAGAYLSQNRGISLDSYRRRLTTKLGKTTHGIPAERTIARIWDVTLHTLQQVDPLAVELLHTAAWLAPDDIPHSLLTPPDTDPDDVAEAIGTLAAYSMVIDSGRAFSVHRLVQTVLRTAAVRESSATPAGRRDAERAIECILYPEDSKVAAPPQQWIHLIPHVTALAASAPPEQEIEQAPSVYELVSQYLQDQGQSARALPIYEYIQNQFKKTLGDTHPASLMSSANLACSYMAAGNLQQAISLFKATLTQSEKSLGDTHFTTLTICNNLASAYAEAGDHKQSIPLLEQTLANRVQTLGENHIDTLTSRNNLAHGYESAGEASRAIPLFETNLAKFREAFGENHPKTLYSQSNLSYAYEKSGDLSRAISLHEITLAKRLEVLGDSHPETLQSKNHLGRAYHAAGDLERAIPLLKATLLQRIEVLGEDHPDTLISQNNLALAYKDNSEHKQAIRLFETTLAQEERILGQIHPGTLITRNNLALAYSEAGNLRRAIQLHEVTLAQQEQLLGELHPGTLTSQHNLAGAYREAGDIDRAIDLLKKSSARHEQIHGDTHPETLNCRSSLAYAYKKAGAFNLAINLYEATLKQCIDNLGDEHQLTVLCRRHLGESHCAAGNYVRAISLFKTSLAECEKLLGTTHPQTLIRRHNLAAAYMAVGNFGRAIPLYKLTISQCEQTLGREHPQTLLSKSHLARIQREQQSAKKMGNRHRPYL